MKKILLIEDDNFLAELIGKKMAKVGFELIRTSDGEGALQKLTTEKPDLILLDLILPGAHGFEILRQLKEQKDTKDIPVVILSNLGQKDEIEQGLKLGAVDFLIKAQYTIDEIVEKMKKILGE